MGSASSGTVGGATGDVVATFTRADQACPPEKRSHNQPPLIVSVVQLRITNAP